MNSKIYIGEVTHARLAPVKHNFRYPVYFYAFQLEELSALATENLLFGYNQIRPVAIHDKDYLIPGEAPIREKLDTVLKKFGLETPLGEVTLVTSARYFNYIFNPISFFYCHDPEGCPVCVLTQVNNTFGEMHLYLLNVEKGKAPDGRTVIAADKEFHVSPFFPRQGHYEFKLTPPAENIDNMIHYYIGDLLSFVARIRGRARAMTTGNLAKTLVSNPVCASLTMPRILWQAARLYWQKKLPVYTRPVPDSSMTIRPVPPKLIDRLGMYMTLRFFRRLPRGDLKWTTPDGVEHRFGQPGADPSIGMSIKEYRFFRRIMLSGDTGFGEAYTDGDWETSDLPGLLTLLAANEAVMDDRSIFTSSIGRLINYFRHLQRPNTKKGSSRNIQEHYDLSNDFFATFLDPTLTYSCALFEKEEDTLEQAQINKLRKIIEKTELKHQDHVLEIGCGWGSFAIEAVRRTGCRVTGITVSEEQLKLARQRVIEAGLEDQIDIHLCDYRHIQGRYTKIVSIEMIEAVGHAGLKPFFSACEEALEPGGRAVIQAITIPDRKYNAYRFSSDWIRKHIFPGGHLPSIGAISKALARTSSLNFMEFEQFGANYVKTLDIWRRTFLDRREKIRAMGYDEGFLRKWEYYFAYCQAGFAAQIIDLAQMVLHKVK